jgi:ribonuclease-3
MPGSPARNEGATPDALRIERQIGHSFHNPVLLVQALTHRSHSSPHNERLEFLGDSLLNCVIAGELYARFSDLSEGDLSRFRSNLVRQQALADLALGLELGALLRLGEGEMKSGGAKRPSIMADALEALFGAVYVDAGFAAVQGVIQRLYAPILEHFDPSAQGKDPKTMLQEYLQGRHIALPQYLVVATRGQAHAQRFEVECVIPDLNVRTRGEGASRRIAEQDAAKHALLALSL